MQSFGTDILGFCSLYRLSYQLVVLGPLGFDTDPKIEVVLPKNFF